jgi:triphosphoribosyl-dephospho-CoA synthase
MISLGLCANLACIWEATARKSGNVHRYRDFDDCTYLDFLQSAAASASVFDKAAELTVGRLILGSVTATRQVVSSNTNLGILLLLAPLAKAATLSLTTTPGVVATGSRLPVQIRHVLQSLTVADAEHAYQAIRLASPSGLGTVPDQDIAHQPTQTLREVMALAADRDLIAAQYTNDFQAVFADGLPALECGLTETGRLESAIVACHLHLLASHPDSLIARKCGMAMAEQVRLRAQEALAGGPAQWDALDRWLRSDGHSLNPGTTADLVAACLFVALASGMILLPPRWPW